MITPEDIAWAERRLADGGSLREVQALARLILTVHQHINDHESVVPPAEEPAHDTLPPEPPVGTVVLDRDGEAFQSQRVPRRSRDVRWFPTAYDAGWDYDWADLNAEHGPLTVLGPVPEPPPAEAVQWAREWVTGRGIKYDSPLDHVASYIFRMNGVGQ